QKKMAQYTKAQLMEFMAGGYQNRLSFAAGNNPWAVHNLIHAWHPGEFSNWQRGLEKNDQAQQRLFDFLIKKAEASGDPEAYALALVTVTPYNAAPPQAWTISSE